MVAQRRTAHSREVACVPASGPSGGFQFRLQRQGRLAVAGHSFGQPDHEARSLTQSALDQQLGIHKPAIPVCERQPESGIIAIIARRLLLGAAEGFE